MEQTYTKTRVCELCGKTITYKTRTDDGYDWHGHQKNPMNYNDEWDYSKSYITIEELSNFKPND